MSHMTGIDLTYEKSLQYYSHYCRTVTHKTPNSATVPCTGESHYSVQAWQQRQGQRRAQQTCLQQPLCWTWKPWPATNVTNSDCSLAGNSDLESSSPGLVPWPSIHGRECWRNRQGLGWHTVSQKLHDIQYYRVLNIIILKLYNFYNFWCCIVLNNFFYYIIKI